MVISKSALVKFGVLLIAFACGSCSRGFHIEPSGFATNVRLGFEEGGFIAPSSNAICISTLTVSSETWPHRHPSSVTWQIKSERGCVTITGVDVGHVPAGFKEVVNRLPLKQGQMYGATADSEPEAFYGASMPWFVCREGIAIIDWKNSERLDDPPARCK